MEKEIARGRQFRAANGRVRSAVSAVALPASGDAVDIDKLAAEIGARISRSLSHANGVAREPAAQRENSRIHAALG